MPSDNYPAPNEIIRNVSRISLGFEIVREVGKLRIVQFDAPGWDGYQIWVINEKGFLWEPAASVEAAEHYLQSAEAVEYNASESG